jgi:hypothetical protein
MLGTTRELRITVYSNSGCSLTSRPSQPIRRLGSWERGVRGTQGLHTYWGEGIDLKNRRGSTGLNVVVILFEQKIQNDQMRLMP